VGVPLPAAPRPTGKADVAGGFIASSAGISKSGPLTDASVAERVLLNSPSRNEERVPRALGPPTVRMG